MRERDDDSDWELPEYGDEDESLTVPCPACGTEVHEDAEQCPVCGEYVTHSTRAWDGKPLWWVILGLAGIIAVIFALTPGL